MIPAAASITFGGSYDSISTVSNSPEKRQWILLSYWLYSAPTVGRDENIKLDEEHQKKSFLGRCATYGWTVPCSVSVNV